MSLFYPFASNYIDYKAHICLKLKFYIIGRGHLFVWKSKILIFFKTKQDINTKIHRKLGFDVQNIFDGKQDQKHLLQDREQKTTDQFKSKIILSVTNLTSFKYEIRYFVKICQHTNLLILITFQKHSKNVFKYFECNHLKTFEMFCMHLRLPG